MSSYLVSHSHDPVDWYPWGEEAFARARELDRPVFVSIGYDSCHWCHVMQRESFRDEATAERLNRDFVAIKVDREVRPDVDHLYMTYTQLATGSGGWPMSVFVTPERAPFFAGTYFPKAAPYGLSSFSQVLDAIDEAWTEDAERVRETAGEALAFVASAMTPSFSNALDEAAVTDAIRQLVGLQDPVHGGVREAPKFPQAPAFDFLVAAADAGDQGALDMARRWLYGMIRSGTYDQAAGGLFRYSTDSEWLVPHFEKMLYDNAQLLRSIAAFYRLEPSDELAYVARQTAAFLDRDLATGDGLWFSSLDAETGGVEGGTYVWDYSELEQTLTAEELELARKHLGASPEGNWQHHTILTRRGGRSGEWPLTGPPAKDAPDAERVDAVLAKLLAARTPRPQPRVIRNVLTNWNALAIRGLFEAGVALGDNDLVARALAALAALLEQAVDGGSVAHASDAHGIPPLVDDYATVAMALLAAYEAEGGDSYRALADDLLGEAIERFVDEGVVFVTTEDSGLPLRPVEYDDAPTPSGAATLVEAWSRLRPQDAELLARMIDGAFDIAQRSPFMAGTWLRLALSRTV
jgi:hypothetical protein